MKLFEFAGVTLLLLTVSVAAYAVNPVPFVNVSLSPAAVAPGNGAFTLTVSGAGFVPGATVDWNNSARTTAFVSSSKLTATITAADVASTGTGNVTVVNPAPGGGASNVVFLPVVYSTPNVTLQAPTNYKSGFNPPAVAVGDINGDGILDIVSGNFGSHSISRFIGNGSGGFQAQPDLQAKTPLSIAIADVNRDGIPDLLSTSFFGLDGQLSVYLGTGQGAFRPHVDYTSSRGFTTLTIGDINGDGFLDVISSTGATSGYDDLYVFFGAANGAFLPVEAIANGQGVIYPQFGDFNGDGILDIAGSGQSAGYAVVMLGNGDGTFQPPLVIDKSTTRVIHVAAADLNGDGILDLVATTFRPAYTTFDSFLGNGDGTFVHKQDLVVQTHGANNIVLGDFNGDGKLDAMLSDGTGFAPNDLVLGNGDGTFQTAVALSSGDQEYMIAAGDFNRDGRLDLAAVSGARTNYIQTYLQNQVLLSPTSLNFGNQKVGTTSSSQNFTVYNLGKKKINISDVNVSGSSASEFVVGRHCASIPAGKNCVIAVSFAPTTTGSAAATVNVVTDSPVGTLMLALSGNGTH